MNISKMNDDDVVAYLYVNQSHVCVLDFQVITEKIRIGIPGYIPGRGDRKQFLENTTN